MDGYDVGLKYARFDYHMDQFSGPNIHWAICALAKILNFVALEQMVVIIISCARRAPAH